MSDEPFASTEVVEEAGRFVVMLDVVFPDGAVRHRVGEYHSRSKAEVAAKFIKATAERNAGPGWGM
ncbi:MAG: hypothetical protein AAGA42_10065 [Actinomycetota bacterium]